MKKSIAIQAVIANIVLAGCAISPAANAVPDQPEYWEKCAGITKAGKNDCGSLSGKHACAGQAEFDNLDDEWVYVPKGSCEKITGGKVAKIKPAKTNKT